MQRAWPMFPGPRVKQEDCETPDESETQCFKYQPNRPLGHTLLCTPVKICLFEFNESPFFL